MIKREPLSKLSFDKHNKIVVCNYKNEFIDLDNTKGILKRKQSPDSPDMLYIDNKKREIWFIEFKSSTKERLEATKEKIKLRKKLFAGLFLIYEIFCKESCNYKDYKKYYFVVYNKEQKSFEDELLGYFDEDSERSIEFNLGDLKPQFVEDIFTENCLELKNLFRARFNIDFIKENNEQHYHHI